MLCTLIYHIVCGAGGKLASCKLQPCMVQVPAKYCMLGQTLLRAPQSRRLSATAACAAELQASTPLHFSSRQTGCQCSMFTGDTCGRPLAVSQWRALGVRLCARSLRCAPKVRCRKAVCVRHSTVCARKPQAQRRPTLIILRATAREVVATAPRAWPSASKLCTTPPTAAARGAQTAVGRAQPTHRKPPRLTSHDRAATGRKSRGSRAPTEQPLEEKVDAKEPDEAADAAPTPTSRWLCASSRHSRTRQRRRGHTPWRCRRRGRSGRRASGHSLR